MAYPTRSIWFVMWASLLCLLEFSQFGQASRSKDYQYVYSSQVDSCNKICVGGESPDERVNCVNKCLSPDCFTKIYGQNPLEDGEIDEFRKGRFSSCLISEKRGSAAKKNWEVENNVSEEEKHKRDSEW